MKQITDFKIIFTPSCGLIALLEKTEEGYFFPILSSEYMAAIDARLQSELGREITRQELDQIAEVYSAT